MTIEALNAWRRVYLAEAGLYAGARRGRFASSLRAVEITLTAGAALWLMHDLAHGRWPIAAADVLALAGCLTRRPVLTLGAVVYAAANPEHPPSPYVWSRRAALPRHEGG